MEKVIDNDEIRACLFSLDQKADKRLVLSSKYIKPLPLTKGSQPEPLTDKFVKRLLYKVDISDDLIIDQVRLISKHFEGKDIERFPDFGILNAGKGKSLLFEVEALNKRLDKKRDKKDDKREEGIEQAQEWFEKCVGLEQKYNAVVTNFNEWYILIHDKSSNSMKPIQKKPHEILEIIRDVAIGEERPYLEEVKGEVITKKFFQQFSRRLRKLTGEGTSKTLPKINIRGLIRSKGMSETEYRQEKINYYRTIFFRMMFIKILLDWKLLRFDPVQEILDNEEPRNYFKSLMDLFFNVFNNEGERIDVLEKFKELPYLNGGLFRVSEIEESNPTISLNSDAIIDIWQFLKTYNFTLKEEGEEQSKKNNSINPSILGYIFEKSIGDYRKETGAYYTRSLITRYMAKNTLERYLLDNINKKFKNKLVWTLETVTQFKMLSLEHKSEIYEYSIELLKNVKICDPAIGSGAFLVSIGNLMVDYYNFFIRNVDLIELSYKSKEKIEGDRRPFKDLFDLKSFIVQNNLYGVDINPSAVEICELRLWLWIVQPPPQYDTIGLEIEPLPNIEYNIRVGNSLLGYTKSIKKVDVVTKRGKKIISGLSPLSEWAGKKEDSLRQMLIERNKKIRRYYGQETQVERESLRLEIKELTNKYVDNFDKLLLGDFQKKNITGREITILPQEFNDIDLTNIESITIRSKKDTEFDITEEEKDSFKKDEKSQVIRGITFRKNYISFTNRVFSPDRKDKFKAQDPETLFKNLLNLIDKDTIKDIKITYFIGLEDLRTINPFHWSMEFSDFFTTKGFDIILTNPPYGNILSPLEKLILKESDKITEDAYLNFLLRIARKEIPCQYAGILTPKSYLLRQKYLSVRNFLLENVGIYEITDIGSNQFQGPTNEVQILFFHGNKSYSRKLKIKDLFDNETIIEYDLDKDGENPFEIDNIRICQNRTCKYYDGNADFYYYTEYIKCPECNNDTAVLNRIRIKQTEPIYKLIKKIEKKADLNFLNTVDFPKMIRGEEDTGLTEVRKIIKENVEGTCYFIDAKNDFKYNYIDKNKSFNLEEISADELKGENYEYYMNKKLLIKHNSIVPETIYTEEPVCFTSSIYSLLHKDNKMLKYLSAILNSSLIQFYCWYAINNQKDTTINLNQYMIRHLPIVEANQGIIDVITENVDHLTLRLEENNGQINNESKAIYREIDNLIFDIYSISEGERDLIDHLNSTHIEYFKNIYDH